MCLSTPRVSVLFNEPKLLKSPDPLPLLVVLASFSALQRAEIAEIAPAFAIAAAARSFSALQRAEIAEINVNDAARLRIERFQCSSTSRNC